MSDTKDLLHGQFIRFAAVGAAGFIVDVTVLYFGLYVLELGYFSGRLLSYFVAATATWYLNRHYTFVESDRSTPIRQWIGFLAANGIGGVVNFGTYSIVIIYGMNLPLAPLIGTALGSIAGLVFNFSASRTWIFKR